MKKLLLIVSLAIVAAVAISGCTVTDYGCSTYFKVLNLTGTDIVVDIGYPKDIVHKSTSIKSGNEEIIYNGGGRCAKEGVLQNPFNPEYDLISWTYIEYVKINGEIMPDELRKSKYWTFSSTGRRHDIITFTLTLTNELLEKILAEE